MKCSILTLCLLATSACFAFADGIPVDRKTLKVTVPHEVLTLSESQIEEIDVLGTLTLDTAQWKRIRAFSPNCPKRFGDVLPVTYSDCTCDVGRYAIALSRTQVAVLHDQFDANSLKSEFSQGAIYLRIDARGQFYHAGVLIPFQQLLDTVRTAQPKKKSDGSLPYFVVQLPAGVPRDSDAIRSRLEKVYHAAKQAGWSVPD